MNDCPFCDYEGPSPILKDYGSAFVIEPLNPVVPGHVIAISRKHVEDVASDFLESMCVMGVVAVYINEAEIKSCNVITSRGAAATQSIFHLHVHIIPRRFGDELGLPWS